MFTAHEPQHLGLPCVLDFTEAVFKLSGPGWCSDASALQSQVLSRTKQGNISWPGTFRSLSACLENSGKDCGDKVRGFLYYVALKTGGKKRTKKSVEMFTHTNVYYMSCIVAYFLHGGGIYRCFTSRHQELPGRTFTSTRGATCCWEKQQLSCLQAWLWAWALPLPRGLCRWLSLTACLLILKWEW